MLIMNPTPSILVELSDGEIHTECIVLGSSHLVCPSVGTLGNGIRAN